MSDDLISRKAVLHILYDIKDDDNVPKNYGTVYITRETMKIIWRFAKCVKDIRIKNHGALIM